MFIRCSQIFVFIILSVSSMAQYKSFSINAKGDTINAINLNGQKTGKWVIEIPELRGEPGYVEEGLYQKGVKDGYWRQYSIEGDLIGVEQYKLGGKDGLQQYFTFLGALEHEENWRGYNPEDPYDTIAVYGTGSGEIIDYKIVKAEPYSVKQGEWKYYDVQSGRLLKTEMWERNVLQKPNTVQSVVTGDEKKKKIEKTDEMKAWELKNKGKKRVMRDGATGL